MLLSTQITTKKIITFLAFLLSVLCANAQAEQWFTTDNYLSSSLINTVLYDSRGMLWIATEDCLNRFDGSKFTVYRNDPSDPHSIGNNYINGIYEDSDGRIFVCTHIGIQIYNPATDAFSEPLKVKATNEESSPLSEIVQRSNGELWAIGNEVYRIVGDPGHEALEHMDLPSEIRFIRKGIADKNDNIWLTKNINELFRISPDGSVKSYFTGADAMSVTAFALDGDGKLYIGTGSDGLLVYNSDTDEFDPIDLGDYKKDIPISTIYPDEFGNLLIGTDGAGMLMYNPKRQHVGSFPLPNIDYNKLKVHGLAKDSFGNLWIGVYQKGIAKIPRASGFFRSIDQRTSNLIGSSCITAILRDSDGILWVGTDNDDVYAVDRQTLSSRHFTIDVPKTIMGMYEDSKGRLWLGSYNRGMGIIDRHSGKYTPMPLSHNGIKVNHVYDFAELPDGDMLVCTMGSGLFKYNPATRSGKKITIPNMGDWLTSIDISDTAGNIVVGSYDGVFIISPDLESAQWALRGHIVSSIHQEPKYGEIWVGTNSGLVRLKDNGEIIKTYTTADGLPSDAVYAIEHGDDALWISTNHGLSKFNVMQNQFTNFNSANGLPNNEFYRNASFKDTDGNIYFGGINGIATFKSSNIDASGQKLTLRVTDFLIGDKAINANTRSGGHSIIDVPVTDAKEFRLGCDDNSFSIVINTQEFVNPSQAELFYSFDDEPWTRVYNGSSGLGGMRLTFTNVASGRHTLRFKAVNAGIESDIYDIDIVIDTVWYATWWAKLIYLMLVIGVAFLIYRQIRNRIRVKRAEEERRHKAEMLESRLQFFTNISHEIRTPLSLVIGPMQKLLGSENDPDRSHVYRVVMRNANRILRLVNELMDLRKLDNNQMKLKFSKVNICNFVGDLYETFSHAAKAKNINFAYHHPDGEDITAWVDMTHFDKVIMNLLSNAIKFTPDGGSIDIDLSEGYDESAGGALNHFIEISVTDSGIGISEEDRRQIFDRFFQASNNKVGGTGIGLHLTSQLVALHHGTIDVENNPSGKGARFVVRIPADDAHLKPEEKCLDTPVNKQKSEIDRTLQILESETTESTESKAKAPRSNELVYIVEDDKEIRNYLETNLSKYYKVCGFSNGRLALDAIHKTAPSLVITDVMMPEMDGYTLTKKIRQNINLNHIPVIVLTAKTREEDNLEAIDNGASVYIAKPFNIDVLIRTAQNLVEHVTRLRNAFSGNQSQADKIEAINVTSNDDKLMERVMKVINKNLSNSDITVEMIAREIGISRVHLHRKLKELTNQSTRDFIRNIRLQTAANLLKEKKLTVAEVSDLVGFKQANNFSTVFKEMFGMSPTAYAAKYQNKSQEQK